MSHAEKTTKHHTAEGRERVESSREKCLAFTTTTTEIINTNLNGKKIQLLRVCLVFMVE